MLNIGFFFRTVFQDEFLFFLKMSDVKHPPEAEKSICLRRKRFFGAAVMGLKSQFSTSGRRQNLPKKRPSPGRNAFCFVENTDFAPFRRVREAVSIVSERFSSIGACSQFLNLDRQIYPPLGKWAEFSTRSCVLPQMRSGARRFFDARPKPKPTPRQAET